MAVSNPRGRADKEACTRELDDRSRSSFSTAREFRTHRMLAVIVVYVDSKSMASKLCIVPVGRAICPVLVELERPPARNHLHLSLTASGQGMCAVLRPHS